MHGDFVKFLTGVFDLIEFFWISFEGDELCFRFKGEFCDWFLGLIRDFFTDEHFLGEERSEIRRRTVLIARLVGGRNSASLLESDKQSESDEAEMEYF